MPGYRTFDDLLNSAREQNEFLELVRSHSINFPTPVGPITDSRKAYSLTRANVLDGSGDSYDIESDLTTSRKVPLEKVVLHKNSILFENQTLEVEGESSCKFGIASSVPKTMHSNSMKRQASPCNLLCSGNHGGKGNYPKKFTGTMKYIFDSKRKPYRRSQSLSNRTLLIGFLFIGSLFALLLEIESAELYFGKLLEDEEVPSLFGRYWFAAVLTSTCYALFYDIVEAKGS